MSNLRCPVLPQLGLDFGLDSDLANAVAEDMAEDGAEKKPGSLRTRSDFSDLIAPA